MRHLHVCFPIRRPKLMGEHTCQTARPPSADSFPPRLLGPRGTPQLLLGVKRRSYRETRLPFNRQPLPARRLSERLCKAFVRMPGSDVAERPMDALHARLCTYTPCAFIVARNVGFRPSFLGFSLQKSLPIHQATPLVQRIRGCDLNHSSAKPASLRQFFPVAATATPRDFLPPRLKNTLPADGDLMNRSTSRAQYPTGLVRHVNWAADKSKQSRAFSRSVKAAAPGRRGHRS